VVILGARGSIPVEGLEFSRFGGATSCVLLRFGETTILLDAGSGIAKSLGYLPPKSPIHAILLSHTHLDHIMGLLTFPPLYSSEHHIDIYAPVRANLSSKQQIERLMSEPLWPAGAEQFSANVTFPPLTPSFAIGDVQVLSIDGNHPGHAVIYRLNHQGKSIVYCTDFEHNPDSTDKLIEFSQNCDLLIYDAQYSEEEYVNKHGWGHSTWEQGILTAQRCRAGKLILFHHDPQRTDSQLGWMESLLQERFPNLLFAKQGDRFEI
jgi:phosphoribosyl 1,2-cyclic phosphodiesterase